METSDVISQHGFVNSLSKAKLQIGIFSIQNHDAGAFVAQDKYKATFLGILLFFSRYLRVTSILPLNLYALPQWIREDKVSLHLQKASTCEFSSTITILCLLTP